MPLLKRMLKTRVKFAILMLIIKLFRTGIRKYARYRRNRKPGIFLKMIPKIITKAMMPKINSPP